VIKAVIFDMDGVIVESEPVHIRAEKQTLQKYGIRTSSEELQKYTGTTAKFMFEDLIKKYGLAATSEEMFDEKEEIMFKLLEDNAQPTKGVLELIKNLKAKKTKLGIASSAHRKLIDYFLSRLEIEHLFDVVISAEEVRHSKPDPEIFLKAASELGVLAAECVVVEDAGLGVEAAKKAGMKCVGYRNLHSGNQDLSKADVIVDDFSKLGAQRLLSL
jgi:beta-phosphoglucomutase family hydrolase